MDTKAKPVEVLPLVKYYMDPEPGGPLDSRLRDLPLRKLGPLAIPRV